MHVFLYTLKYFLEKTPEKKPRLIYLKMRTPCLPPDIRPKKNLGLDPYPNSNPKLNEIKIQNLILYILVNKSTKKNKNFLSSKNLLGPKNIRNIFKKFQNF